MPGVSYPMGSPLPLLPPHLRPVCRPAGTCRHLLAHCRPLSAMSYDMLCRDCRLCRMWGGACNMSDCQWAVMPVGSCRYCRAVGMSGCCRLVGIPAIPAIPAILAIPAHPGSPQPSRPIPSRPKTGQKKARNSQKQARNRPETGQKNRPETGIRGLQKGPWGPKGAQGSLGGSQVDLRGLWGP